MTLDHYNFIFILFLLLYNHKVNIILIIATFPYLLPFLEQMNIYPDILCIAIDLANVFFHFSPAKISKIACFSVEEQSIPPLSYMNTTYVILLFGTI